MKKYLAIALPIVLLLHSCNEGENVNPTLGSNQNELFPVSSQSVERLSDEKRQQSIANLSRTYAPEELYIHGNQYEVRAIDYNTGDGYTYYADNAPFTVMASTSGYIFGVAYGELWRDNPSAAPSYMPFGPYGTGWEGTEAMAGLGGYIYAVQGGTLWRVNASNGAVIAFGNYSTGWEGTEAMTAIGSYVYAVQGGTLWRVHTGTQSVTSFLPTDWEGTEGLASYGGYVYGVQGGTLWKVNTSTGAVTAHGTANWSGTQAMTAKDGYIFIVKSGVLYKISTSSSATVTQLTAGNWNWSLTACMTARM